MYSGRAKLQKARGRKRKKVGDEKERGGEQHWDCGSRGGRRGLCPGQARAPPAQGHSRGPCPLHSPPPPPKHRFSRLLCHLGRLRVPSAGIPGPQTQPSAPGGLAPSHTVSSGPLRDKQTSSLKPDPITKCLKKFPPPRPRHTSNSPRPHWSWTSRLPIETVSPEYFQF